MFFCRQLIDKFTEKYYSYFWNKCSKTEVFIMRKVYVDVVLRRDASGNTRPLTIQWEDGTVYEVDRLIDIRKAASLKVGGGGKRYEISVCGRTTFLFEEDGRFFVEAK